MNEISFGVQRHSKHAQNLWFDLGMQYHLVQASERQDLQEWKGQFHDRNAYPG